ncbi:hypothetical protein J5751_00395 [bacterium]|nr:hypothetical protein [bacterium]
MMNQLTNDEFIEFFESFKEDYFCSVSEISKVKSGSHQPLIWNNYKMFSFDEMCKKYRLIRDNLPKTMDAIKFKIDNDKLTLYLIEFKNFDMVGTHSTYQQIEALHRNLKKKNKRTMDYYSDKKIISDKLLSNFEFIKNHFVDSVEFDLKMKPIETIFVALPWLYELHCEDNGIEKKDFRKYLDNIDIRLIVFINRYAPHENISADRLSAHQIDNSIKEMYNRLYLSGIIAKDYERILSRDRFNYFIQKENL